VPVYDEEGVDAGGVTREWYSVLARSIFNPGYALFQPSSSDQLVYQPNPHSYVNVGFIPPSKES
jgi:E3 ubiquitin-protein ligase HUWE1